MYAAMDKGLFTSLCLPASKFFWYLSPLALSLLAEIFVIYWQFGPNRNYLGSDLRLRIYFDNVTLALHNVTLTSQKPYQYNNKFDSSKTLGYNIPQDAINEV